MHGIARACHIAKFEQINRSSFDYLTKISKSCFTDKSKNDSEKTQFGDKNSEMHHLINRVYLFFSHSGRCLSESDACHVSFWCFAVEVRGEDVAGTFSIFIVFSTWNRNAIEEYRELASLGECVKLISNILADFSKIPNIVTEPMVWNQKDRVQLSWQPFIFIAALSCASLHYVWFLIGHSDDIIRKMKKWNIHLCKLSPEVSPRADDIYRRAEFGLGDGVDAPLGGCGGLVHVLQ